MSREIIEKALREGHLLSPDVMEEDLDPKNLDTDDLVVGPSQTTDSGIEIRQERGETGEVSVEEMGELYRKRHRFFRQLLEEKADPHLLVSASNAGGYGSKMSLIGMVREVGDDSVIIDDTTGKVKVFTEEELMEDECVLVRGEMGKKGLEAETVLFPDVPMGNEVTASEEESTCLFTASDTDEPADLKVMAGQGSQEEGFDDGVIRLDGDESLTPSTPCTFTFSNLLFMAHRVSADDLLKMTRTDDVRRAAVRLLRARHLEPPTYLPGDPALIREIPDIVCLVTGEPFTMNYKGITVVSPTPDRSYRLNLKTREIEEA